MDVFVMTHTLSLTFYCGECTTQTSPAAFVGLRSDALLLRWWMDGCHTEVKAALLSPPLSPHCRSHRKLWPTLLLPNHCFFSIHHITVLLKPLSKALKFLIRPLLPFTLSFAGEMIVTAWCQTYQSHFHWETRFSYCIHIKNTLFLLQGHFPGF